MPTQAGLPKSGEIWVRRFTLRRQPQRIQFRVVQRVGRGNVWSLKVQVLQYSAALPAELTQPEQTWDDASDWFADGEFTYVTSKKGNTT